ncbi:Single-strand binding protein family protein [Brevibacterium sp. 239c]|uniref:single-stranded DNA-binding protein n=1 Tax=Brevibacterium sp. 239c TaxID=1965356 RepID=UPI000C5272E0|nr:single-stranded DNA-binding protein [Brevibacterium sp. 239c]SMY04400.1 Single-strand binding protein family protein [Brevibacterium sp. 239c]
MAEKRTVKAYVADDPKLINSPEGKSFVAFPVVDNKRYKDPDTQEWKDAKATRYEVTVDQPKLRDNVLASLEKGQRVSVEGNYVPKPYIDGQGNQRVGHKIYAHDVSASYMHESQGRGGVAVGRDIQQDVTQSVSGPEAESSLAWGQNPDPYPEHSQQFADRGQAVHQQYSPPPPPDHAPDAGLGR